MGRSLESTYRRRLASRARLGFVRRLGGRWGGYALVGPLLLGGIAGQVLFGGDRVTAGSLAVAAVAGLVGVAAWVVLVAFWSVLTAPAEEDAGIRADRDYFHEAVRESAARLDLGAEAFRDRLDEGNALARRISGWPRPRAANDASTRAAQRAGIEARKAEWTAAVREWNDACRETVRTYLPFRVHVMDRKFPRGTYPTSIAPQWALMLREEVQVKIERMDTLQREYEEGARRA